MTTTPAEQAGIDTAAAEYEARQARTPAQRDADTRAAEYARARQAARDAGVPFDRYTWEHARWRQRRAAEAATLVAVRVGDLARRILVDGRWIDGRWQLVATSPNTHDLSWVEARRRAVVAHAVVQGWEADDQAVAVADRWSALQGSTVTEPEPDCPSFGQLDPEEVKVLDNTGAHRPYTASDDYWCPECEHTVPLAAYRTDDGRDVLVLVEHDRAGRSLD